MSLKFFPIQTQAFKNFSRGKSGSKTPLFLLFPPLPPNFFKAYLQQLHQN
jgi:hypothetical protein